MKSKSRTESAGQKGPDNYTNYNINDNILLSRFSTSEAVVNYFIKKIKEGHLIPGDMLPSERLLQNQLQISRFSFRDYTYQGVNIKKIILFFKEVK